MLKNGAKTQYFSLEIRRRFWHPKNPRIGECPVKLRTLVRSRTLSADFYDFLTFFLFSNFSSNIFPEMFRRMPE